ncbi:16.9 kDa class I heat shock protein 1-like [Ananas comosus]|uniref:16.9 kDa class I heat shock protein 1-like n=1 Tax=Ananas comosus TaxID=4615 RepID=A0A6P5F609_ANACO|nr:16.9 kDa class I heat shock protein 1-like [Ananas comosus]
MSSLIPWVGGRGVFDPFTTDLWDPFGATTNLLWDVGRSGGGVGDDPAVLACANVDWRETDRAHIFVAELPGVRKEDVKVEVEDGNVLKISGERVEKEEQKGDTWHRMERRRGAFLRRFRLPDDANLDDVNCTLKDGVLTAVVPKKDTAQARNVRAIKISEGGIMQQQQQQEQQQQQQQ